jgi:DNA-binding transcriptional regulator YdaS (Cro superfamily)
MNPSILRRERSALKRAVAIAGGQTALALALGHPFKQQHIHNWLTRQRVPLNACVLVERATQGIVRCEELRGDVHWLRDADGFPVKYEVEIAA